MRCALTTCSPPLRSLRTCSQAAAYESSAAELQRRAIARERLRNPAVHAYGSKSGLLERMPIEGGRALEIAIEIALDVVRTREQPEIGHSAQSLRELAHSRSHGYGRNVVQYVVA